jgi:hypothetical protein
MPHITEYLGHMNVTPALNSAEVAYLREGSYDDATAIPAKGRPRLWCPWVPSPDGRRLSCPVHDADLVPAPWLRYLIVELLKPGARRSYRKELKAFTFDHHVDGMVVGHRPGGELFAVTASRNRVRERVLRPAAAPYVEPSPESRDDEPGTAKVIPLRRYR